MELVTLLVVDVLLLMIILNAQVVLEDKIELIPEDNVNAMLNSLKTILTIWFARLVIIVVLLVLSMELVSVSLVIQLIKENLILTEHVHVKNYFMTIHQILYVFHAITVA